MKPQNEFKLVGLLSVVAVLTLLLCNILALRDIRTRMDQIPLVKIVTATAPAKPKAPDTKPPVEAPVYWRSGVWISTQPISKEYTKIEIETCSKMNQLAEQQACQIGFETALNWILEHQESQDTAVLQSAIFQAINDLYGYPVTNSTTNWTSKNSADQLLRAVKISRDIRESDARALTRLRDRSQ